MKALSHTKSNRVLFFLSLVFFTVLLGGCQNTDLIQKDVNIEKINQVISMVNQSEILLGINTLSNSEKSYAWHKTISEKTKELIHNKSQSELVSEVLRELENPNYFDGSKRSEEIIRSLNNRARLLFDDDDYGNIFLLLVDKDEVVKSVSKKSKNGRNGVKAKDGVITDPQSGSGTGGTGYCTCSTSAQCWVYIWGWWGTCYWDQDQCYTHGYRVNGCGFTGADICDGKCGS